MWQLSNWTISSGSCKSSKIAGIPNNYLTIFTGCSRKEEKLQYDRLNLQRAFEATQRGVSVYKASRDYSVPESTLRDRTRGLVDLDVKIGFDRIFSAEEEEKLVGHVSYMAEIRYG